MNSRFDYTILDAINNAFRTVKAAPLVLGSTASGAGGPPGGIVGWLPQARVAYDPLEISSSGTALSGMSIVDNLNHIRYRLDGVEASGSSTFLGLSDTPASYFGEVGKAVIVNATEDGLEFAVISGGTGATAFLDLTDVTGDYSLNAGFTVKVNNTEDGLIFDQETFLKLADAPHDYATYSGKYVKVNATEDALEFGAGVVNDLTVYEDGIQALTEVTGLDFVGLLDVTTSGNTGIVTFSGYSHTHVPNDIIVQTYPEMILNGGFDDDSVWVPDYGWSIGGGVAIGTAVDGYTIEQEIPSIEVGSTYRVSFDLVVDTGSIRVNFDGNHGSTISTTQHYEEDIVAGGTYFNIEGGLSDLFTGTIDNVSVKKPTTTLLPYLTKLDTIETGAEVNNITDGDATDLTDSGETTLHSHPAVFAGHIIQDEGTPLTTRGNLNFVGSGIEVTDDAGNDVTIVTFSGGGSVGTGTPGQVVQWGLGGDTLVDAALIPPATKTLTLTATAASTLGLAITAGKTLTLTATDNFNLTIPATGIAALLATANVFSTEQSITTTNAYLKLINVSVAQYDGSGFYMYNSASSFGNNAGVYFSNAIKDVGATQSFFVINRINYLGNYVSNLLTLDVATGFLGINSATPTSQFYVYGTGAAPSLSTDTQIFTIDNNVTQKLTIGANNAAPYDMWFQNRTVGTAYPLSFNPLGGGSIFNESGAADGDFRAESDNYDALFIDASNDSIMLMSNAAGKVGFFGITAVVQQLAATDLGVALSNLGLRVAGTAYPITTTGAVTVNDVNFKSSTPSALAGDVNNWDLGNFTFIRASGGAADRIITGIVARADGHLLKIHNIGTTNKLSFANESASSTAANRLINSNAGTTEILPNHAIQYIYDATTARWREETHL